MSVCMHHRNMIVSHFLQGIYFKVSTSNTTKMYLKFWSQWSINARHGTSLDLVEWNCYGWTQLQNFALAAC